MIPRYGAGKGKSTSSGPGIYRSSPYVTPSKPAASAKPPWGAQYAEDPTTRTNSADPDEGRMIYVGGVPPSAEWQELKDHMKQVGTVEFVQILNGERGLPRGVGFVRYATEDEANAAMAELNGSVMEGMAPGKTLIVDAWTGQKPLTNKGKAKGNSPVGGGFAGGTSGGMFGKSSWGSWDSWGGCGGKGGKGGKGEGVWLSWDQYEHLLQGKGRGQTMRAAQATLSPGFGSHDPTFKVRIEGLPDGARWQELKDHFKQAGTVEFCNVKAGSGEVRFSCAEEAEYACELLNGSELMDAFIVVEPWS